MYKSFLLFVVLSTLVACTGGNGAPTASPTPTSPPIPTQTPEPTQPPTPEFDINEWFIFASGNSIQRLNLGNFQSVTNTVGGTGDFLITPDGQSIVFVSGSTIFQTPMAQDNAQPVLENVPNSILVAVNDTHALVLDDNNGGSLYAIPLIGGVPVQVNPKETALYPDPYCKLEKDVDCSIGISPDGTQVAYFAHSTRAGTSLLYLSPFAGGKEKVITEARPGGDGWKSVYFSPDGHYLMYRTDRGDIFDSDTFAVPLDEDKPKPTVLGVSEGNLLMTTSNHALAARDGQIFSLSLEDGSEYALIPGTVQALYFSLNSTEDWVMFDGDNASLRSVPITGDEEARPRLIEKQKYRDDLHGFKFSPDGKQIAVVFYDYEIETASLYTIPAEGGELTTIAESTRGTIAGFAFSPDSQYLVAYVLESDGFNLYSYNLTDGTATQLNKVAGGYPNRGDLKIMISADSTQVAYTLDEDEVGKYHVYRVPIIGGDSTQVFTPDKFSTMHFESYPSGTGSYFGARG